MGDVIFSALIGTIVGFILGGSTIGYKIRSDAVKSGFAFYDCAPDTGKCEFKFKGE